MSAVSRERVESPPEPTEQNQTCDLSVVCPYCGIDMDQEHAHMRCSSCGYRDSCCF